MIWSNESSIVTQVGTKAQAFQRFALIHKDMVKSETKIQIPCFLLIQGSFSWCPWNVSHSIEN